MPKPKNAVISKRVLIVDDEPENATMLASLIKTLGGIPTTALSGQQAIELLNTQEYELTLLDIQMPTITGWDLIRHIKGNEKYAHLINIAVTAIDPSRYLELIQAGFDAYHFKPVNIRQLAAIIDTHLTTKLAQGDAT